MTITIENLQRTVPISPARIRKAARRTLESRGIKRSDLSIVFVTRQKIQALNKRYLKRSYATDVLSFDLSEGKSSREVKGEVIIATDQARKNAKVYGSSVAREIELYVVHGVLHLLGFDDHSPSDIKKMRAAESKILKGLGYAR